MGLMNLLAELHSEPELKLNLKFEIEVLCKHLSLEISELRPGNVLKDYQRFEKFLNFKVIFWAILRKRISQKNAGLIQRCTMPVMGKNII